MSANRYRGRGEIEHVSEFQYFGSIIAESGLIDTEIDRRIANASKAFGALRQAVFKDSVLTINTKIAIYRACVLSVLLYGGECWTLMSSSEKVRERWGDCETIAAKLQKRRLEWLGHLARMPDYRMPKITLFSWLP